MLLSENAADCRRDLITKQLTMEEHSVSAFLALAILSLAVPPGGQTSSPKMLKMHLTSFKLVALKNEWSQTTKTPQEIENKIFLGEYNITSHEKWMWLWGNEALILNIFLLYLRSQSRPSVAPRLGPPEGLSCPDELSFSFCTFLHLR